jgi:hypothetical protein
VTSAGRHVVVDLEAHYNNDGISYAGDPSDGWFNTWGNTFPAEHLPESGSEVTCHGVPFLFPSKDDGRANNIACAGQRIDVPASRYDWIHVLGAGERRSEDPISLVYAGGGLDREWLRISDFWPMSSPWFGELLAFRCPVLHYPRHVQPDLAPVVWMQRVPVPRRQALTAMVLPDNAAIHLFAMTLERSTEEGRP